MSSHNSAISPAYNTPASVVVPFYGYAALFLVVASCLLFCNSSSLLQHYFNPKSLAITHAMALGWGTMMILGASHQLVPVMIDSPLYSEKLGYACFLLAAIGIPLLVYGFYSFNLGAPAKWGGRLVILSVICFLVNLSKSFSKSKQDTVHGTFLFTAVCWLLLTTLVGLILLYNMGMPLLPEASLHYLTLHAHIGIVGWFLLMIMGVAARLIPMFLVSKYVNAKLLWWIYALLNIGLMSFCAGFFRPAQSMFYFIPAALVGSALLLFLFYCYQCYQYRIKRSADQPVKLSLLAVMLLLAPLLVLLMIIATQNAGTEQVKLINAYGFSIFFGWITALILGMTFKTLPFIIWNKVYHSVAGLEKVPPPATLFNNKLFIAMAAAYILGFGLFMTGIFTASLLLVKIAAALLLLAALLFNGNVFKIIFHRPIKK